MGRKMVRDIYSIIEDMYASIYFDHEKIDMIILRYWEVIPVQNAIQLLNWLEKQFKLEEVKFRLAGENADYLFMIDVIIKELEENYVTRQNSERISEPALSI